MSDLMAILKVCGEKMICIDYDRPVWQASENFALRATPNLDHFVVDGILACLSGEALNRFGITARFNSLDFEKELPSYELKVAREIIYHAENLDLHYFHDAGGDIQIHQDLARFKMANCKLEKVSTQFLTELSINS